MEFRIADTFSDSLEKLNNEEKKTVKTTAFDLQINPINPGLKFHRLDRAKDKNFWSIRVSRDLRIIVHKTDSSLMLCYTDHHDAAYRWAARRKIERHPKTGAAQLVEIRERVEEIVIPTYVVEEQTEPELPPVFEHMTDDELLNYGVPQEWLEDVRGADSISLYPLTEHLPDEAAEALLELATGGTPSMPEPIAIETDPFDHPDAKRRFRVMENEEALQTALEYPWEKWMVFLHPDQQKIVKYEFNGPARVSGSAGTGKTVVALHRAVYLARENPEARVLLTTFSEALANSLRTKLRCLINSTPRLGERIEVQALNTVGHRLYESNFGKPNIVNKQDLETLLSKAASHVENHGFNQRFLLTEWHQVVDAWQIKTWESYRDVLRLGRRTRLSESRRIVLWEIYSQVQTDLENKKLVTYSDIFNRLTNHFSTSGKAPYDFIIVDESQDLTVYQIRFLASMAGNNQQGLFFAGDLGQRIFQQPFSWLKLGVDIRGRSKTLRTNYRTSHQIRMQADLLLGPEISDVDGVIEVRGGTVSVFNGPKPIIQTFGSQKEEAEAVGNWFNKRIEEGYLPHEIGVFVRAEEEFHRAQTALEDSGFHINLLDEKLEILTGQVSVGTMHLAKGLEFRAVVVMACDDEVIPSQTRIETVVDEVELEEVYITERHLLYVACTRSRDHLLVTGVNPVSEFLDDLRM